MISLCVVQLSQTFHFFYGEHYIVGDFEHIQQYSFVLITSESYVENAFQWVEGGN
jgi:hypothetical protein